MTLSERRAESHSGYPERSQARPKVKDKPTSTINRETFPDGMPLFFIPKFKGTMNIEDLERLRKGQQMLNDIDAHKSMIEDLKQGIENKDTIKNAVMFVSASYEIRVTMTKEAAVDVMQVVLEKYKQELVELEKQFEEL